jgi:hypothetical protein
MIDIHHMMNQIHKYGMLNPRWGERKLQVERIEQGSIDFMTTEMELLTLMLMI